MSTNQLLLYDNHLPQLFDDSVQLVVSLQLFDSFNVVLILDGQLLNLLVLL